MSELPVVEVGPVAHGGHCVARLDGQVVFVRHALPGEQVRIRVTESNKRFARADAVEVLRAAPDRVEPPCALAGMCGGCDFQHVSVDGQLALLTDVVREQLDRLAGIGWSGRVEAVEPALGWRTRMTWAVTPDGRSGLRRHRSHEVVAVDSCPIAHPDLPDPTLQRWDSDSVETIVSSTGERLLVTDASIGDELEEAADGVVARDSTVRAGRSHLTERVLDHDFRVTGSGFWQVHPQAASTLVEAVMDGADSQPGDTALDLYAGVGLFTAFLADAVGETGRVISVEADPGGHRDARRNLHERDTVQLVSDTTERALRADTMPAQVDVVVLDPPRVGAKNAVQAIADLRPRRVVYVACDPAALARDLATFGERGYALESLRAFALFPMTHHVECVAVLVKSGSGLR